VTLNPRRPDLSPLELIRSKKNEVRSFFRACRSQHRQTEDQSHSDQSALKSRRRYGEPWIPLWRAFEDQTGPHRALSGEPPDLGEQSGVADRKGEVRKGLSLDEERVADLVVAQRQSLDRNLDTTLAP